MACSQASDSCPFSSQTRIAFTSSAVKSQEAGSLSHSAGNLWAAIMACSQASDSCPFSSQIKDDWLTAPQATESVSHNFARSSQAVLHCSDSSPWVSQMRIALTSSAVKPQEAGSVSQFSGKGALSSEPTK